MHLPTTRHWEEPTQRLDITLNADLQARVHFSGRGSVAGARALTTLMDELRAELPATTRVTALVDLRDVHHTPLRAQLIIGRWLLTHRDHFERIAVFGGHPLEMGLARAVMTLARMGQRATFERDEASALTFLGWTNAS